MKMRKLTAQQAVKLWTKFFNDHGAEQMGKSYGWTHAPANVRSGELVFSFHDQIAAGSGESGDSVVTLIGWGSIQLKTWDASDDEAALSVGVFPMWQRRGYAQKIYARLLKKSQELGADYASQIVYKDNEAQHARVLKDATENPASGWIHAGENWYDGHDYFVYPFDEQERKEAKEAFKEEQA
jgi:ribosomal protein S18 acetylase RimI-like enzyme